MKIWDNRKEILEGIKNNTFKKEHIEQIAKVRNDICSDMCPHYDVKGVRCEVKGTGPCCGSCGCSLALKTRALSSKCPIGKWHELLSQEDEDNFLNEL